MMIPPPPPKNYDGDDDDLNSLFKAQQPLGELYKEVPASINGEKATAALIDKEEAGTVQREEKEVSTAASHNLAKNILANCHF
mmetsp:Transcript_26982/g.47028  ORF Transcript_26982/g.47028 Transcript_26982/m.47028 type:complete len:83 (+) Transcript_26982:645-893(+)